MGHVLLRQYQKIRIIRDNDPPLLQGVGEVHVIRRATQARIHCRRDVNTPAPQAFGDRMGHVLVKMKAYRHHAARQDPGFWRGSVA